MSEVECGRVGNGAEHLITKMRDENGEIAVGNTLPRLCEKFGEEACKASCQLREIGSFSEKREGECAEQNMVYALEAQDINPKEVLVVKVTDNNVGFADRLDEYNPLQSEGGWQEVEGFNAFFARTNEFPVLGRRLADCADVNFELEDAEGNKVIGFEHGTRTNMRGNSRYMFDRYGEDVSFTTYALGKALDHYNPQEESVKIKLAAAIQGENFQKHFDSREAMERHLPGWFEAGYLENVTNPNWLVGDKVVESDTWYAHTRRMIIDNIYEAMDRFGIPAGNFSMEGIIDPAEDGSVHSSHENRDKFGSSRDLYMTLSREKDK